MNNPFVHAEPFLSRMDSPRGVIRHEVVVRKLASFIKRRAISGTLVDIGCGDGRVALELAPIFERTMLFDPSSEMVSRTQRALQKHTSKQSISVQEKDFSQAITHIQNDAVDILLCHAVLNWMPRPWDALEELLRYAKKSESMISLLVGARDGYAFEYAVRGDVENLSRVISKGTVQSETYPDRTLFVFPPHELLEKIRSSGASIHGAQGVRIFADLMPPSALEQPTQAAKILELELLASEDTSLWSSGDLVHILFDYAR